MREHRPLFDALGVVDQPTAEQVGAHNESIGPDYQFLEFDCSWCFRLLVAPCVRACRSRLKISSSRSQYILNLFPPDCTLNPLPDASIFSSDIRIYF